MKMASNCGERYYSFFKGLFLNNPEFLTLNELKQLFKVSYKDPAIFDFSMVALTNVKKIKIFIYLDIYQFFLFF